MGVSRPSPRSKFHLSPVSPKIKKKSALARIMRFRRDGNSEKDWVDFSHISVMALVGLQQRGALVFILPDCWAASLVCLLKLAQQGPVVARVISSSSSFFLSFFNINSIHISLSRTSRVLPSATSDQYILAPSELAGWEATRSCALEHAAGSGSLIIAALPNHYRHQYPSDALNRA